MLEIIFIMEKERERVRGVKEEEAFGIQNTFK